MRDFEFGDQLYSARKKLGLTQTQVAQQFGITNKAVSKWENGVSKPALKDLEKISQVYGIPVDKLLNKSSQRPHIFKIAITGGPCSGKSTAMSWIQSEFSKKGYRVIFIPETATELLLGGFSPENILNIEEYIIKLQIEKERIFCEAAEQNFKSEKVLIVCDRGVLDCKAYIKNSEFGLILNKLGLKEVEILDSYDAVFHLVSAAKGAESFYQNENNKARYESIEEARAIDEKTLFAWTGHPHLRIIDNSTDFRTKMQKLLAEISAFLGEPQPLEIERKFLIKYPPIKELEKMQNCQKVEIVQTYLKMKNGECRIRQRGRDGYFTYTKTIKKRISAVTRIETEERLSKEEYINLLLEIDDNRRQIRKTRYCLVNENQYFEIDVYPFWKDKAIMEIELKSEDQEYTIPHFVKVIKEVTGDPDYENSSIALKIQ